MKKIMIYTKNGLSNNRLNSGILFFLKENSLLILMFTLFLCGTITGASLFDRIGDTSDILKEIALLPVTEKLNKLVIVSICFSAIVLITEIFGALCAVGLAQIGVVPLITGYVYSLTESYLISNYAIKGLGYFCIIILPGAIISAASIIYLSSESAKTSKKSAEAIFGQSREEADLKDYFIRVLITAALLLLGIIINCICVKMFVDLF